jgi:tight adherence protein B
MMALDPAIMIVLTTVLAAGGAALVMTVDRRQRLNTRRVAAIVNSYRPTLAAPSAARRATARKKFSLRSSDILAYLGIRIDRPDLYPMPWGGLLGIATAVALAVDGLSYFLVGSIGWMMFPVVWTLLTRQLFKYFETRRNRLLYNQLPDALSMIVRSVRVGVTVQDSLFVVGEEAPWPTSIEFQRLNDEIRVGTSLSDALIRLARRSGLIEYRFFAVALTLQSQSGGNLSETLENLADIVRKRVALRARAIALAAEARLTMYVLAGLPFFTTGALMVIEPDYLAVLVTTSMGKKILFGGIGLLVMGLTSMRVIIRKSIS